MKQSGHGSECQLVLQFRNLIVSAVKIGKQCLQIMSASERRRSPDPLASLRPLTQLGDFRP